MNYKLLSKAFILSLFLIISGCSSKIFSFKTSQQGSLIIMGNPKFASFPPEICGNPPVTQKILFLGKADTKYVVALKRGFCSDTALISKNSPTEISLNLKPIPGTPQYLFNKERLKNARFFILPVNSGLFLHKGVGKLDKYVKSEELTREITDSIDIETGKSKFNNGISYLSIKNLNKTNTWSGITKNISEQILSLNPLLLDYYPTAPKISDESLSFLNNNLNEKEDSSVFYIYVWCKSIKPTSGRIIGNVAAAAAGGALQGYETAVYGSSITYFDPNAFTIDNSTLCIYHVIHSLTGEVVSITSKTINGNLTNQKCRSTLTNTLLNCPDFTKNKP